MKNTNIYDFLKDSASAKIKKGFPILSFPAVQKLNVSIKELVNDANLAAKAIETVANETDSLAAISLMDLSVEAEAFGAKVRFCDDEIPAVVGRLVESFEDAQKLTVPSLDTARISTCTNTIKIAKEKIPDKPLFAGMIGPYSLAGRLMDVTEIMYLCFDEPETVHIVLDKCTQFLISYANALKSAGANGIMIAEPLAGILSRNMAEEFSIPYVRKIISAVQNKSFAVIYHNCGNAVPELLESIYSQGAYAYHFGNAVDMEEILKNTPENIICMGNIDPVSQFTNGTRESMRAAVTELMDKSGAFNNFIPSSGCDIPAHANWNNIDEFFKALSERK